jgi:hypothetical protein
MPGSVAPRLVHDPGPHFGIQPRNTAGVVVFPPPGIKLRRDTMPKIAPLLISFALVALATQAVGQQPPTPTVRIRGTIEAVDGPMLSIKSREGTDMKVKMTDNVAVFAVVKTDLSQIKEGSYIGVTAMPQPDGVQKAVAVHIFPENQRGAAEGFRPWDARPNSTMTNATVAETVKGTDGQNILVKYKDGEKKVVVPPDTPIVTFVASDKSEIKPGAKLIIFGATKKDDGTLEANRVNVGRDGITPPM